MKSLMLLSQPNTGSTWLAECIRLASPKLRSRPGDREFFNPAWNWECAIPLSAFFGGELMSSNQNIARTPPVDEYFDFDECLKETWDKSDRDFTKETYLAWQIQATPMQSRFDVIGLVRDWESSFPPSRGRVKVWYDNIYWSLRRNGKMPDDYFEWENAWVHTAEARAMIAWQIMRWKLERVFASSSNIISVWDFESLTLATESELRTKFAGIFANCGRPMSALPDPDVLARIIVHTRNHKGTAQQHARQWKPAFNLLPKFIASFESRFEEFL